MGWDGTISADAVADLEAKFNVELPANYVGIPKPVFAFLAFRHVGNSRKAGTEILAMMEPVLLTLTRDEAYAVGRGAQLSVSRCNDIARELSVPIDSVKTAIGRFWFFWNEGRGQNDRDNEER